MLVNVRWRLGLGIMGARFFYLFMVLMVWYLAERKKL